MNAKQSTHGKLSGIDGTDIQILQISAQIDGIAFFHLTVGNVRLHDLDAAAQTAPPYRPDARKIARTIGIKS